MKCGNYLIFGHIKANRINLKEKIIGMVTQTNYKNIPSIEELREEISKNYTITKEEICDGDIEIKYDNEYWYDEGMEILPKCNKCGCTNYIVIINEKPRNLRYYIQDEINALITKALDDVEFKKIEIKSQVE